MPRGRSSSLLSKTRNSSSGESGADEAKQIGLISDMRVPENTQAKKLPQIMDSSREKP